MREIIGGVCAPRGFKAGGIWCGIKASSKKRDLGLIYSEKACTSAALFTTNRVKAASVQISQKHIAGGKLHAIIVNSGNANACTGEAGLAAARRMAELAADAFAIAPAEVAVASTGVIGVPFPIAVVEHSIGALANSLQGDESGHSAALEAIMTTDTRRKEFSVEITIGGVPVRIGGMAKGAGMIHPNMATMLSFITTDAAVSRELLEKSLRRAVQRSFNRVTVDGDTSTNDAIIIMANGESGAPLIAAENDDYAVFAAALEAGCITLARAMARDGEGATKLVTVTVHGAADEQTAEKLAKAVAGSSLVKAACFGADANWGRILCALGYSGAEFDPAQTTVRFQSPAGAITVCSGGEAAAFSEEQAKAILSEENITILIDIGNGSGNATVWGCDLTYDYVKINGDYRS